MYYESISTTFKAYITPKLHLACLEHGVALVASVAHVTHVCYRHCDLMHEQCCGAEMEKVGLDTTMVVDPYAYFFKELDSQQKIYQVFNKKP